MSPPRSSRCSLTPLPLRLSTTLSASRAERNKRSSLAAMTMSPRCSLANSWPPIGRSSTGTEPETPSSIRPGSGRAWWKLTQPLKPFDLRVADDRQKQRPFPWPSPASRLQFWKKMALTRLPLVFAAKRVWQRTWHSASFRARRASSIPRHAGRAKAPTSALGAVGSG
jgi:hypothetical protein